MSRAHITVSSPTAWPLTTFTLGTTKMKYTRELVRSKAQMVFPDRDVDDIMAELDAYGADPNEPERDRVQLAILKLSEEFP